MSEAIAIIGSGLGGLAVACLLGKKGFSVDVYEKNEQLGGVCNSFTKDGFTFDMGPSWYLMPDVFEAFFKLAGERVEDHLDLIRLAPSYQVAFKDDNLRLDLYSDLERDIATFGSLEPGSGERLREYLALSATQYKIALDNILYRNCDNLLDLMTPEMKTEGAKLPVLMKMHDYVSKFFKDEKVQKLVEYQLVFLGSSPYETPALYNIMSHIDFNLGVFYPRGGIYTIAQALVAIGRKHGVRYHTNAPVAEIMTRGGRVKGVRLEFGDKIYADRVVSDAGIHHTETRLLAPELRTYSPRYWETRTLAPSAFILYLGIRGRVPGLRHHSLIFARDWKQHFDEIFKRPIWPSDPSLYVCAPSVTDESVAPPDHENLFVLVPIAPGLTETPKILDEYTQKTLKTVSKELEIDDLGDRIVTMRRFVGSDFAAAYNHFGGSALGLAHTLRQTSIMRPNNQSRKARGLYYVGADTNPGIGMPICLISAELAYKRIVGDKSGSHLETL